MKSRQLYLWLGGVFAVVATLVLAIDYNVTCGWAARIPWSCLAWSNLGSFKAQLAREVPPGADRSTVEDYLRREGIPIDRFHPLKPSEQEPILVQKALSAGLGNPFDGFVYWFIVLDGQNRVDRIEFSQQRE